MKMCVKAFPTLLWKPLSARMDLWFYHHLKEHSISSLYIYFGSLICRPILKGSSPHIHTPICVCVHRSSFSSWGCSWWFCDWSLNPSFQKKKVLYCSMGLSPVLDEHPSVWKWSWTVVSSLWGCGLLTFLGQPTQPQNLAAASSSSLLSPRKPFLLFWRVNVSINVWGTLTLYTNHKWIPRFFSKVNARLCNGQARAL